MSFGFLFLVIAVICFVLAAIGFKAEVQLGYVGLAFFAGAGIIDVLVTRTRRPPPAE